MTMGGSSGIIKRWYMRERCELVMRKKIISIMMVICTAALASGCGNKIPEMTEEQQELIVEYAAGTVLKYDKNYESRLVEITLEETVEEEKAPDENASAPEEEINQTEADEVPVIDNTEAVNTVASIEEFLQFDFVKINYTGYEVCDVYPDNEEADELYFFMNATEGNKLIILKFLMENISGEDREINIAQSNVRFKIAVNGVEKNALTTMLLNDLAYYYGQLAAGESVELVLVCEVPDEQAGEISSLELNMQSADSEAVISIN